MPPQIGASKEFPMPEIPRIEPSEVLKKRGSGSKPWLVCAYDDEARCRDLKIDNAMTLGDFTPKAASLPKDEEIVFYCA
jgi:hypothetical protein